MYPSRQSTAESPETEAGQDTLPEAAGAETGPVAADCASVCFKISPNPPAPADGDGADVSI